MEKYIGILILLLSIALIHQYIQFIESKKVKTETPNPEPFYSNNRNTRTEYGIPNEDFIVPNTAYMSTISNESLVIFVDEGGKLSPLEVDRINKGKKVATIKVRSPVYTEFKFNPTEGDKIYIYNYNSGISTTNPYPYWAGHIYVNGQFYTSNSSNFKIIGVETRNSGYKTNQSQLGSSVGPFTDGFERIGCYADRGDRRLPIHHYPGRYFTLEDCREIAYSHGSTYFGSQAGGQCFSGNDLDRATNAGERHSNYCGIHSFNRADRSKDSFKKAGWSWTNDVHSVSTGNPSIRYFGWYKGKWPTINAMYRTDGKGLAKYKEDTYALSPEIGGDEYRISDTNYGTYGHAFTGRWIQYYFDYDISKFAYYCADNDYVEHNPSGCSDPTNKDTCENSVNKGWVSKQKLCLTPLTLERYSYNDYDNITFFSLMNDFFYAAFNFYKSSQEKYNTECTSVMRNMEGTLVKKLKYKSSNTDKKAADSECCKICVNDPNCEFWVRDKYNNLYLKKDFKGYKDSTTLFSAFKASDSSLAEIVYKLLTSSRPFIEKSTKLACQMIKNVDSKYNDEQCLNSLINALDSDSSSYTSDLFVRTIIRAMKVSSERFKINGKNQNQILRVHLEKELLKLVKIAKAVVVKSAAIFVNCKCTSGSANCAPC